MEDMKSVMSRIDKTGEGVYVQATTLGSLEALLEFLKTPGVSIPVSGIGIGPVHKKNVIKASVMLEKKKEYSTILAFDVKVTQGARELSDELGVKVFMADIIYHLFDQFKAYIDTIKEEKKKEVAEEAVLPCVLKIIPNCVFKKKDPIVLGVDVLKGIFRIEELELKKKQQETKAIETSRKAIPSMVFISKRQKKSARNN
ncbi:eukaryotic translation initiation factor 5B-like isoform X2 [Solanum tuberosum]|uniref:eukaryotic translation initiation factor 5B-like isoform X2 n=1 Tax=Solanum tuberosum TaxID=4113 RepID=UPI00073A0D7C|nr:PREDICTED: eukaryotic translation initiation factor 5B-like isoform X2 [Solanum tuberosum]